MTRHFLNGEELSTSELSQLLRRADELKAGRGPKCEQTLVGKSVVLFFEKPSTRTRISFEVGVSELGGTAIVLREGELQLTRGESLRDTALVLSRYVNAVVVRTGPHELVEELARHAQVSIVNALTQDHHPCQALADLQTLQERFGRLDGLRLAYVGDGNNVAHSLLMLAPKLGVEVAVATPVGYEPDPAVIELARAQAKAAIEVGNDPVGAARGANALYTDVWVSMGDESKAEAKRTALAPFALNEELLRHADRDAIAMHCLPAHPGEEISEQVLYGPRSAVWDQAENRLHSQKALLEFLLVEEKN